MALVPRFPVRERDLRANRLRHISPLLVLSFMALVGLLAFDSSVQAQTVAKPNPEIQAYTIVATPDGSSLCRDATPQEKRNIVSHPGNVKNLRLINHLDEFQKLTDGVSADVNDPSLPGLKIFLLATPRLDANPTAKAAFIKAAKNWEDVIKTPMTIYIKVDVGPDFFGDTANPYDAHTIGSTSSALTARNFSDVRTRLINTASNANETALYGLLPNAGSVPTDSGNLSSILVSVSLARALGFLPANATETDTSSMPQIGFNSAFNFDYDQSNGISSNLVDFTAVATHEIGHALGFSSMSGDSGGTLRPAILDLFRFRPGVSDFANAQRIMTIGGGEQIFFAGSANVFTNSSSEAGLSNGGPDGSSANGGDGRQSSHWKDNVLGGFQIGIMDPTISNGVREDITANDLKAFNYMGYNLENSTLPPQPTAPANDNFANAQVISGCTGSVNGTNLGATKEAGEGIHFPQSAGGVSVWYQWIAPSTGSVTITTLGSSFDTTLGIYTGNSVSSLQTIIESDDVNTSQGLVTSTATFNAVGGTTYRIAVDGYLSSDTGSITLNWTESNCGVASPPVVQFNQVVYPAQEGVGSINITVTRSAGDPNAAFTVNYATADTAGLQNCNITNGIASSRCDYVSVVGTLHFAPGDASKTIFLPIVDDAYPEGTESFSISLSSPTAGALLGAQAVASIQITDNGNDAAGVANPIDQTGFFVRQHYIDFLGREPDPPGLAGWSNQINNCVPVQPSCDRLSVSQGIYLSPEFRDRGYFIYKFFSVSLGRKPSYGEFVVDRARVSGFQSDAELEQSKLDFIADFMARVEFANIYNGLSNNAYVQRLFSTAGVTQVSVGGTVYNVTTMQQALAGGRPRAQVLREIAESPEASARFINEATIVMHYFGYLRRDPDAAYQDWINILTGTGDSRNVTNGFVNSAEYRMRFGQP